MKEEIKKIFNKDAEINKKIEEIEDILERKTASTEEKIDAIRSILEEIKDELVDIHHDSVTDDLTGFLTKRYLKEIYEKLAVKIRNKDKWLALIVIDIDCLKMINDSHGHLIGTKVIEEISKVIKANIRKSDFAARYGGDEFVILCIVKSKRSLNTMINRLKKSIHAININNKFTASGTIGSALSYHGDKRFEILFEDADKVMYKEKKRKKQCVIVDE
jgi:diguanylate cyclase (GGDEF)-like protein